MHLLVPVSRPAFTYFCTFREFVEANGSSWQVGGRGPGLGYGGCHASWSPLHSELVEFSQLGKARPTSSDVGSLSRAPSASAMWDRRTPPPLAMGLETGVMVVLRPNRSIIAA